MTDISSLKLVTRDEATKHLFEKIKGENAIAICQKMIEVFKSDNEKVIFTDGRNKQSFSATLVRAFSKITSKVVTIPEKYELQDVTFLFSILLNLKDFSCSGIVLNYDKWQPICMLVNAMELAKLYGMTEISSILNSIPDLLTDSNRNALNIELQKRDRTRSEDKTEKEEFMSNIAEGREERQRESRSRTRSRSLTRFIKRSLSRGTKSRKMESD